MREARLRFCLFHALVFAACGDETIGVQVPTIQVDPTELDLSLDEFGTIRAHEITLRSVGSATLEVRAVTLVGANDGDPIPEDIALFVPESLPKRIAPNSSFSIELQHIPRDARLDEGRVIIASDDPAQPLVNVPIRQRAVGAPRVAVVPDPEAAEIEAATPSGVRTFVAAVQFGQVQVGLRRVEAVHFVNIGGGSLPLEISSMSLAANVPGLELRVEPNMTQATLVLGALGTMGLRPGTLRSVRAELAYSPPTATSTFATVLRVESSDPTTPIYELPLSGGGPVVGPGSYRVEPAGGLDFGSVRVGQTADRAVTVHNDGSAPIDFGPLSFTANPNDLFSLLETPASFTVGAGQSRAFNLRFAPAVAGLVQGNLRIVPTTSGLAATDYSIRGQGTEEQSCTPAQIDPTEPANGNCSGAQDRGPILLSGNQVEQLSFAGQALESESDADWNRYTIEVADGCSLVGYEVTARATLGSGEQAQVCVSLGACGSPERENCSSGTASILLVFGSTLCNSFNNQVPFYVRVERTGGTLACEPYSVNLTAR